MENKLYEDRDENEIEIDVMELLYVFKKKAWIIILAAIAGCIDVYKRQDLCIVLRSYRFP